MTQEEQTKPTKQKILEVANDLFAKHGFAATSVRDIASAADVNLAAINYHFKNKDNLYWRVFEYNYELIDNEVKALSESAKSTEDLAISVFHFFTSRESAILNTFKMFLNDFSIEAGEPLSFEAEEDFGPPGSKTFLQLIERELSEDVTSEQKDWLVKMIFSIIVHHGVIMSTTMMKEKAKSHCELSIESLEEALRHAVRSFFAYVKSGELVLSRNS